MTKGKNKNFHIARHGIFGRLAVGSKEFLIRLYLLNGSYLLLNTHNLSLTQCFSNLTYDMLYGQMKFENTFFQIVLKCLKKMAVKLG